MEMLELVNYDPPGDAPDADAIAELWLRALAAFNDAVPAWEHGFAEWQERMRAAMRVLAEGVDHA